MKVQTLIESEFKKKKKVQQLQYRFSPAGAAHQQLPPTSRAVSERVPLLTTMTNPRPKLQTSKLFKLILISLAAVTVALFTAASLRTLSLDANPGLQLAAWEKARNISLVVDARRRRELLANFKGNLRHVSERARPAAA